MNKNYTAFNIPYFVTAIISMFIELATNKHNSVFVGYISFIMASSWAVSTHSPSSILISASFSSTFSSFYFDILLTSEACWDTNYTIFATAYSGFVKYNISWSSLSDSLDANTYLTPSILYSDFYNFLNVLNSY